MSRIPMLGRGIILGLAALLATAGPALAVERWGRVTSIDERFQKFVVTQEGSDKEYTIRINSDTVLQYLDGRTANLTDVRQIKGLRVFALVEENVSHYANKVWVRPDVAPDHDPVNPGVGAVLPSGE